MKKKRRKKRKAPSQKERVLRWILAAVLIFLAAVLAVTAFYRHSAQEGQQSEVRAVWLAYVDFKELGLYDKSEKEFKQNAAAFFEEAKRMSINTVYFHVRAFRDAAYPSEHFPMSRYIWDKKEEISYDPLKIMVKLAHKNGMELHAWLNPYRNYELDQPILDPASKRSTEEILCCVHEVLEGYDVDGIHFDDYFYQEDSKVSASEKMEHVNTMVKAVYQAVKEYDRELAFGISPAGNIGYCESIGADVKTWMSEKGYVDYIVPQIYWTDEHSAAWRDKMFTDTLDEWISYNRLNLPLYPGLALYRAGEKSSDDPGWGKRDDNLARQIVQLREKGCGGFALFSAGDFSRNGAKEEIRNYEKQVKKQ